MAEALTIMLLCHAQGFPIGVHLLGTSGLYGICVNMGWGWQEGVEVEGRGGAAGTCIDPACDACIS